MSVMQCDRAGCESIMCSRLSPEHGYICWSCLDELIALGVLSHDEIVEFMSTPKGPPRFQRIDPHDYYTSMFPEK